LQPGNAHSISTPLSNKGQKTITVPYSKGAIFASKKENIQGVTKDVCCLLARQGQEACSATQYNPKTDNQGK